MIGKRLIFACLILASCSGTEKGTGIKYQDLKEFFHEEAIRLEKQKARVNKTVSRNGVSESRENVSPDWDTELSLFTGSDINKPAWTDSYTVRNHSSSTSYTALDSKLRTRSILIKKNKSGRIIELAVVNRTKNYLYSSSEELLYIPDSLYRIIKKQDVILLGNNSYEISGIFK